MKLVYCANPYYSSENHVSLLFNITNTRRERLAKGMIHYLNNTAGVGEKWHWCIAEHTPGRNQTSIVAEKEGRPSELDKFLRDYSELQSLLTQIEELLDNQRVLTDALKLNEETKK
jgi:hypothetical protein